MRRRLLAVTLAVTTLLVAAFAVPLALLVRDVARDRAITGAERDMAALAPVLAVDPDRELLDAAMALTAAGAEGRLSLWLADGSRLGEARPSDREAVALARAQRLAFSRTVGSDVDVYAPVVLSGGAVAVLRVHVPESRLHDGVTTAWSILAVLAVALLVLAVVATDRLARSVTRPAAELAATSRALASGDVTARAEVGGPPEIVEAGAALNVLADRIDELLVAERERVADLSHRLRTPLTALRLGAEGQGIQSLVNDVDRLEAEVTELIRSARRPLHDGVQVRCDLASVVEERVAFWGALADDDGRTWSCTISPPGPHVVRLTAADAAAAVDVLLGNVFAHTPEGTAYAVTVGRAGDRVQLTVGDAGPGFPPGGLLERGVSGAGSTGLGLDIVSSAARSAGGELRLEPSPLGGAAVVIDVPSADAP